MIRICILLAAFLLAAKGKPRLIAWRTLRRACMKRLKS